MALPKLYDRVYWDNNTTPAINEDNLNSLSKAVDDIDDRVISLAGTIMEDVPQIQEDIEELEEDFALIDGKIADATSEANRATTKANEAAASVISAGNKALISEGYAKGTQNGTPVGSSSPYYHNNAEYFKEQARSFTPTGYQDLVDDVAEAQEAITDIEGEKVSSNDAYVLRQCKGNMVDLDLVGGSVAWNQQLSGLASDDSANGNVCSNRCTDSYDSTTKVHTLTALQNTGTSGLFFNKPNKHAPLVTGHKYLQSARIKAPKVFNFKIGTNDATQTFSSIPANVYNTVSGVFLFGSSSDEFLFNFNVNNSWSGSESVYITDLMLIDLTQLFGSTTIADYIYSLEQATAGAGVAWFRQYFRNLYYAYNVGEIKSVNPSSRKITGKNLMTYPFVTTVGALGTVTYTVNNDGTITVNGTTTNNESVHLHYRTNVITDNNPVILPKGDYIVSCPQRVRIDLYRTVNGSLDTACYVASNESEKSFSLTEETQIGVMMTVLGGTAYSNEKVEIMIRLATVADATYEPYKEYSYDFDTSKQLRGIFKLDANNKMYADGDIYTADGSITRKYGIVDLGSLGVDYEKHESSPYWFRVSIPTLKAEWFETINAICSDYTASLGDAIYRGNVDKAIGGTSSVLYIMDSSKASLTAAEFKTAMSGVYLVYELATPTTEIAEPFQNPQRAFTDGTEEFIDAGVTASTRDVSIPVGNKSEYNTSVVLPISQDYTDGAMEILKEIVASSSDFADFKTKVSAL